MDAFNLVARLTLDTSEYDEALGRASRELPEVTEETEKAEKSTNKLGKAFKIAGAAIGTALTAAAAGATALVKQSVASYSSYQQLVGGVETLFSSLDGSVSASSTVLENAANAFKTAGISANQYMEQVTSFSAALVSSLDGDYQKAAEISDMAIRDMSDNANKMGTSMDAIQNAYQGFAKQNYTMLDNLKLGYGGTKTEMERLLADAEKFSGIKYDISNLSDVYEAIHVIQQEMGITGTTAKEAADTISGSFGSLGAAWQNLVTGFADANADLPALMENVFTAAEGTINNMLPVVEQALLGVADFIGAAAPIIAERLPKLANDLIPSLLETATSVVNTLVSALPETLSTAVDVLPDILLSVLSTVFEQLPKIGTTVIKSVETIVKGVGSTLQEIIPLAVTAVGDLAVELTKPDTMQSLLQAGNDLLMGVIQGIGEALPNLADSVVLIIDNLIGYLTDPQTYITLVSQAGNITLAIAKGIVEAVPKLITAVLEIPGKIIDSLFSTDWNETGNQIVDEIAEGLTSGGELITNAFGSVLGIIDGLLGTNLQKWYNDVVKWAKDAGSQIYQTLHADEINKKNDQSTATQLKTAILGDYAENVREQLRQGATLGANDIEKLYEEALNKNVTDAQGQSLYNQYIAPDISYDYIYDYIKNILDHAEEYKQEAQDTLLSYIPTEAIRQQAGKAAEAIQKIELEASDTAEAVENAFTELGDYKNLGVITQIGQELTEEQKEAQSLAKEVYSASKEYAERQTKYLTLTYNEQIAMWEKIKGQFIEGSEQYLDAEEKIFDIRQKAITDQNKQAETAAKNAEKLQKEQTAALEKQLKEQEKAREAYAKSVEKIYAEVENLEKKYVDTLSSRTQEIYSSFGIFDEVPDRLLISGVDLTNNLKDQIDTIQKFYTDLETLSARGVSGALVDEIRSMGVGALDQLDALLDLSASELAEYDNLVAQKRELAAGIAESELEGLRQETDSKIADKMTELESLSVDTAENLGLNFAEGIAEGIASGTDAIVAATETAMKSASDVFGTNKVSNVSTVATNSNESTNTAQNTPTASKNGYNIVVNINGIQYQNITELAQAVSEEIQFSIERTEKGYAGA